MYPSIEPGSTVLVLDVSYQPLHFSSWKRAILLVWKEKATIIAEGVIRLVNFVKVPFLRPKIPTRKLLFKRDHFCCQYCNKELPPSQLTVDHVVPRSRGGGDEWTNVVAACGPCNLKKGNKSLKEAGMKLLRQPYAPWNKVSIDLERSKNENWLQFCYR